MTLTDFITGYRRAAARRRQTELKLFGPPVVAEAVPASQLDEHTRATLDAEAEALHRTTPASKFSKPAKQGTAWRVKLGPSKP